MLAKVAPVCHNHIANNLSLDDPWSTVSGHSRYGIGIDLFTWNAPCPVWDTWDQVVCIFWFLSGTFWYFGLLENLSWNSEIYVLLGILHTSLFVAKWRHMTMSNEYPFLWWSQNTTISSPIVHGWYHADVWVINHIAEIFTVHYYTLTPGVSKDFMGFGQQFLNSTC